MTSNGEGSEFWTNHDAERVFNAGNGNGNNNNDTDVFTTEVKSVEGVYDLSPHSDGLRISPQSVNLSPHSDNFSPHTINPMESDEGANDLNSCTLTLDLSTLILNIHAFVGNQLPARINGFIDMLRGGNDHIPHFWSDDDAERVPKELLEEMEAVKKGEDWDKWLAGIRRFLSTGKFGSSRSEGERDRLRKSARRYRLEEESGSIGFSPFSYSTDISLDPRSRIWCSLRLRIQYLTESFC